MRHRQEVNGLKLVINGQECELREGILLSEYLEEEGYRRDRIAVEKNGEIVPKSRYEETALSENDVLEVVTFMGGG